MIKYLSHTEIDKSRWDDCISRAVNRRVYAFSWYLDLVCPGWDALVGDEYSAVFPLTHNRKWFISYLFQPYFTQQLGVFSPQPVTGSRVMEFVNAIPSRYRFAEIQLNSMNLFPRNEGDAQLRVNFELSLNPAYEVLSGNYAQNTRRNIRKAQGSGITIDRATGAAELIGLFRENFGKREGKLKEKHYATLQGLLSHCLDHELGYVLSVKSADGALSAGAFFLFDQSRCYFLFAASAASARDNGAMFFLVDNFIAGNAGKDLVLDFEGGNDHGLGRFYKGFGAREVAYPVWRVSHLSKAAETGLNFIRKFRKSEKTLHL